MPVISSRGLPFRSNSRDNLWLLHSYILCILIMQLTRYHWHIITILSTLKFDLKICMLIQVEVKLFLSASDTSLLQQHNSCKNSLFLSNEVADKAQIQPQKTFHYNLLEISLKTLYINLLLIRHYWQVAWRIHRCLHWANFKELVRNSNKPFTPKHYSNGYRIKIRIFISLTQVIYDTLPACLILETSVFITVQNPHVFVSLALSLFEAVGRAFFAEWGIEETGGFVCSSHLD